jgi:Uma2 family endonuclease
MKHDHIGTPHLLLGLLREEKSFAAELLREQGLTVDSVREMLKEPEPPPARGGSASIAGLDLWLNEREAQGGIFVERKRFGNRAVRFAIHAGDPPKESEKGQDVVPALKLALIQKRIDFIVEGMERAIANHKFAEARFYSDEERKERENLRLLREEFHLVDLPPRVPALCIEILLDDRFSEIQRRCDNFIAEGVAEVWLLDPGLKRAYTVTKTEGLREFKGEILQMANPPLAMNLGAIFA